MKIIQFTPGDGDRFLVGFEKLETTEEDADRITRDYVFVFGYESDLMISFWDQRQVAHIDWSYFTEKHFGTREGKPGRACLSGLCVLDYLLRANDSLAKSQGKLYGVSFDVRTTWRAGWEEQLSPLLDLVGP